MKKQRKREKPERKEKSKLEMQREAPWLALQMKDH